MRFNVDKYGITWHEMTNEVDKGDILKQAIFSVDEGETGLTLNAKCFETAAVSFEELVDELKNGTYKRTKQDFSKRTYFNKFKRPDNAAIINWNQPAVKII